jgi:hypothetical protein
MQRVFELHVCATYYFNKMWSPCFVTILLKIDFFPMFNNFQNDEFFKTKIIISPYYIFKEYLE